MKTLFQKFALPAGMGAALTIMTVMGLMSVSLSSCEKIIQNCKSGYPLWCADVGACCPAGHPYNCDGLCYETPCPANTVTIDVCVNE